MPAGDRGVSATSTISVDGSSAIALPSCRIERFDAFAGPLLHAVDRTADTMELQFAVEAHRQQHLRSP